MASIRKIHGKQEQGDRYEIRECRVTERGPRQFTLVSFRGVLTPEVLDEAEERARRPGKRWEPNDHARSPPQLAPVGSRAPGVE